MGPFLILALLSAVLGGILGWLLAAVVPHAAAVAVLALLAAVLWIFRLRVMPGWVSLWRLWPMRSALPPSISLAAIAGAVAGILASLATARFTQSFDPWRDAVTALIAALLSATFYATLIPHLLGRMHNRRVAGSGIDMTNSDRRAEKGGNESPPAEKPGADGQSGAAGHTNVQGKSATVEQRDLTKLLLGNSGEAPKRGTYGWFSPANYQVLIDLMMRWLDGTENPISNSDDDIFDFTAAASSVASMLRPSRKDGPAGTLYLTGQRGSGKSSLLRLVAKSAEKPEDGVSLKFCFVSLWEHADARTLLGAALAAAMASIRDSVDIIPLCGAINSLPGVLFGRSGDDGILDALSPPPSEIWLPALSEVLLRAGIRLIFCVEDTDRTSPAEKALDYFAKVEGFLDAVKRYPGFGYVVCGAEPVWSEPSPAARERSRGPDLEDRLVRQLRFRAVLKSLVA